MHVGLPFADDGITANAAAHEAMSEIIREGISQAEANPDPVEPAIDGDGAAKDEGEKTEKDGKDPWDGAVASESEGFDRFRKQEYRGHDIAPDSMLSNMRVEVEEVHAAATDVGIAARRDGLGKEGAQAMFDLVGPGYQPPRHGEFDMETGHQQVYAVNDIRGWVAKRPAVAALLEEGVQLGNYGPTLLVLGAIAQAAKSGLDITKPSDAKVYVERMMNDPKSPYWTDGPMHKLTIQGVQYAYAVDEAAKKKSKR